MLTCGDMYPSCERFYELFIQQVLVQFLFPNYKNIYRDYTSGKLLKQHVGLAFSNIFCFSHHHFEKSIAHP